MKYGKVLTWRSPDIIEETQDVKEVEVREEKLEVRKRVGKIKIPQYTGKEVQKFVEWVKSKAPVYIKLINGEEFEGRLKWYDQYALKLVTEEHDITIPKHSILYYYEKK